MALAISPMSCEPGNALQIIFDSGVSSLLWGGRQVLGVARQLLKAEIPGHAFFFSPMRKPRLKEVKELKVAWLVRGHAIFR